jgi:hypothetical protein
LELVAAIMNMASFSAAFDIRFKNRNVIIMFMCVHAVCLISVVVFMALLVTRTYLFLSDDCLNCEIYYTSRNEAVCFRVIEECKGLGKFRYAIFILFPLAAGTLVMELVNFLTALLAFVYLRKELLASEKKLD